MARKTQAKRRPNLAGSPRQLLSGRWQARYRDAETGALRAAPGGTFDTKLDAERWLSDWLDGDVVVVQQAEDEPLRDYAERWLTQRDLKPKTRHEYRRTLPVVLDGVEGGKGLGDVRLTKITPARVREWYGTLNAATPAQRSHQYALLRSIMATAVVDGIVESNPCKIKGAGQQKRRRQITIATPQEIAAIAARMPARMRLAILLGAYTQLRFGEVTELRRGDVDLAAGTLRVARGVTRLYGEGGAGYVVGSPKSRAGVRVVGVPLVVVEALREHLRDHVDLGPQALLFPSARDRSRNLAASGFAWHYEPAREAEGRADLRFHDLRHTGATVLAQNGATLADLMARLGHSTPGAAMVYQHTAADRDRLLTASLDAVLAG